MGINLAAHVLKEPPLTRCDAEIGCRDTSGAASDGCDSCLLLSPNAQLISKIYDLTDNEEPNELPPATPCN